MAIGIDPSVLVAATDLRIVQLIRRAIQNADLSSQKAQAGAPAPDPEPTRRFHETPEPVIEPRRHITPTPLYEPRVVHRPLKIEPPVAPPASPIPVDTPMINQSPIQPPWRVLPWAQPAPPALKLKVVLRPPDVLVKGTVYNVFV